MLIRTEMSGCKKESVPEFRQFGQELQRQEKKKPTDKRRRLSWDSYHKAETYNL